MSKRRFEMHHYRQALARMRRGDSDRDIARSRLMGRKKQGFEGGPNLGRLSALLLEDAS